MGNDISASQMDSIIDPLLKRHSGRTHGTNFENPLPPSPSVLTQYAPHLDPFNFCDILVSGEGTVAPLDHWHGEGGTWRGFCGLRQLSQPLSTPHPVF